MPGIPVSVDACSTILFLLTDHLQINDDVVIIVGLFFNIGIFFIIKSDHNIIISLLLSIFFNASLIPEHVPFSLVLYTLILALGGFILKYFLILSI